MGLLLTLIALSVNYLNITIFADLTETGISDLIKFWLSKMEESILDTNFGIVLF